MSGVTTPAGVAASRIAAVVSSLPSGRETSRQATRSGAGTRVRVRRSRCHREPRGRRARRSRRHRHPRSGKIAARRDHVDAVAACRRAVVDAQLQPIAALDVRRHSRDRRVGERDVGVGDAASVRPRVERPAEGEGPAARDRGFVVRRPRRRRPGRCAASVRRSRAGRRRPRRAVRTTRAGSLRVPHRRRPPVARRSPRAGRQRTMAQATGSRAQRCFRQAPARSTSGTR